MPKITEMFAYVAADRGPDDEGVMAMRLPNGEWAPMVGADMKRAEALRPYAEMIRETTGKSYRCLKFKLVGEVTLLVPQGRP